MKLVNAPNSHHESYRLVINYSACSNHIESTTQQWRKLAPPILSTSHCEFNGTRSCAHAQNHPLSTNTPVYYTNSTFIVSTIVSQQLVQIVFTGFLFGRYKGLPSMNNIFTCTSFFLIIHFHRILFRGLAGAYMNPRSFLFVHSLVCPITHSFLNGFQPNLVQHFPYVCSTCHTVFSLKNTLEYFFERLLHCRLIFAITWTPNK